MTHGIKLYPPGIPANKIAPTDMETPVVSEVYDEVVFTDPNESFFQHLQDVREAPPVETQYSQHKHFTKLFSDTDDVHALLEAQKLLQQLLRDAKERLKSVDEDLLEVEEDLVTALEQQRAATAAVSATAATNSSASSSKAAPRTASKNKGITATGAASATGPRAGSPGKKAKQK